MLLKIQVFLKVTLFGWTRGSAVLEVYKAQTALTFWAKEYKNEFLSLLLSFLF
jgi:hypothetical protein